MFKMWWAQLLLSKTICGRNNNFGETQQVCIQALLFDQTLKVVDV